MKRIAIAAIVVMSATPASAQIVCFQNDIQCQMDQAHQRNLDRMERESERSRDAANAAMEQASHGPGLIETIIGLSQQSELHEKQMQVLEAQRRLLEAQRRQISGTQAPAADDDFHPTRMTGGASRDDFKPNTPCQYHETFSLSDQLCPKTQRLSEK